jgi:phosphopantetheinyl transferase
MPAEDAVRSDRARCGFEVAGAAPMLAVARTDDLPAAAIDGLSLEERGRALGLASDRRRIEFVGGRFLLRALLEQLTGVPREAHEIYLAENGKPRCASGVAVSIAHSRGLIACAVAAAGEVGVDIEHVDRRRDHRRLARHYFATDEAAWLESRPPGDFYALWVLKEAWLKRRGSGLAGGLSRLRCRLEPPVIEATVVGHDSTRSGGQDGGDCHLSLLGAHTAFIGVATDAVDHRNLILLDWRKETGRLDSACEQVRLASGHAVASSRSERAA